MGVSLPQTAWMSSQQICSQILCWVAFGRFIAPNTLNSDPWLSEARKHSEFESLSTTAETLVEEARSSFDAYAAY